jgi:drug/metabolite transporter (DMT)-like permease
VGSVLTALGLALQKYSHIQNEKLGKDAKKFFVQTWWVVGLLVFVIGQACNVIAMAYAPQTMLSALGGLSLLFNTVFARLMLGERISRFQVAAMAGVIAGIMLVICFTPVNPPPKAVQHPSQLVAHILLQKNFIGCASGFLCSIIIGSILVVRFWPDHSAVFWAYTTACASGYTVTLFKAAAEVLKYSSHTFSSVVFYVVIGIAVALCLLQIHTLNLALRLGSAVTVVPVYFCLGMLMQLLQAHIAYKELHLLTLPRDIVPFFIGVGLVLISIFVLVRARIDDEVTVEAYKTESKRLSTAAASSTSLGPKLSSPKGKRTTGDQLPGDSQDKRETGDSYKRETGDSYERFAGKASTSTLGSETKDETSAAESTSEAERRPLRENRRTMSDGWYTFSDRCKALRSKSLSTYDINAFRNSFGKNQDRVYTLSLAGPPGIA